MPIPQTNVVGVFENTLRADRAVTELRRAGFDNDNASIAVRLESAPAVTDGADPGADRALPSRVVVSVQAEERHGEVADILTAQGAQSTQWVAR